MLTIERIETIPIRVPLPLLASVPHGTYVEAFSPARDPTFWQMIENRPPLVDGQLVLSDRPGLGWVLDAAFIERHRVDR